MFRISFLMLTAVFVFAKDWVHYTRHSEARDVVLTENGTLWAAFAWGLQERLANKTENTYMPGNNNLEAVDFVQIFALPDNDIIAASKSGILVRKNKNSGSFETINNSYVEKKRNLMQGLGKRIENILILPFEGALVFFDYEQRRSVITLTQINSSSLGEYAIKKISVKDDSMWMDLGNVIWKRKIEWKKIYDDRFLADPYSWESADAFPSTEDSTPEYFPRNSNFPLERIRKISAISGGDVLAWGDKFDFFARMQQNGQWGEAFWTNQSDYGDDQNSWPSGASLAMQPNGNFAVGMWGPGLITFGTGNSKVGWYHSTNSNNTCPTGFRSGDTWTIVQGVATVPNYSGYVFTYVSDNKYGLGFTRNDDEKATCVKPTEASSSVAYAIIARQNETAYWEVYTAWKYSMDSKQGGVDFYLTSQNNFSPILQKKWALPFDSPIDFAFDSEGILWAASTSKIFYLNQKDNEWKEPDYIRGFSGGTISSLEADAQNGLWIGTIGDGAYSFTQIRNSPDSLVAKHYKIKDGLLNESINDIAIDTLKGKVYFAHDLGLSVYSTPLVRSASGYMQNDSPKPIAYPNPFRPSMHSSVTIDYINEKSSVYILDSSGKRVRFFSGGDLRGGAVVWDGKSESGKLVAPGLYHYIAANGKNTAKGKIIVER